MPFLTPEPWETFKYEKWSRQAESVDIPIYDEAVWEKCINLRQYSNKLVVSQLLNYESGPMGILPKKYPVFCKPIYNLYGMGGGFKIENEQEYVAKYKPGYYFMPLFEGEHRSVDVLVHDNVVFWSATAIGHTLPENRFWCWELTETKKEHLDIINKVLTWNIQLFPYYNGAMNFEFLGNGIIEIHFRFASQWCEFYGDDWFTALINLYKYKRSGVIQTVPKGYSFPVWHDKIPNTLPSYPNMMDTRFDNCNNVNKWKRVAIINTEEFSAGKSIQDNLLEWLKEH